MRRFNVSDPGFETAFTAFVNARRGSPAEVDLAVAEIIERVRIEGLAALLDYTKRFDHADLNEATIRGTPD